MRFKLELVPVPVSDMDCAKTVYADQAGFTVDLDFSHGETFRVVQLTPPPGQLAPSPSASGGPHGGGLDPGPASGRR